MYSLIKYPRNTRYENGITIVSREEIHFVAKCVSIGKTYINFKNERSNAYIMHWLVETNYIYNEEQVPFAWIDGLFDQMMGNIYFLKLIWGVVIIKSKLWKRISIIYHIKQGMVTMKLWWCHLVSKMHQHHSCVSCVSWIVWEKMLRRLIDSMKLNAHKGNISKFSYDVKNSKIRNIVITYTKLTWQV